MARIQSILPLGEGFTVYRETNTENIIIFMNKDYSITLYIVKAQVPAVSEDTIARRVALTNTA